MRGKLLFVVGLAAGYVIGARAGRPAYDALTERLHEAAESPAVQRVGEKAEQVVDRKAPAVAAAVRQVSGAADEAEAAAATPASGGSASASASGGGAPSGASASPAGDTEGSDVPAGHA